MDTPRTRTPRAVALALWALACGREFSLPDPPEPPDETPPPTITAFTPSAAFAGTSVRIEGERLATAPDAIVEVRFGGGSTVRASKVLPDENAIVAVVPDDATSGRIAVTAETGRTESATDFTYRGLGRLRYGRIVAEADLRLKVRTAFPVTGGFALLSRAQEWTGLVRQATIEDSVFDVHTEPFARDVGAIAPSGDRSRWVLVHVRGPASCPGGYVERREAATPEVPGVPVCLPDTDVAPLAAVPGDTSPAPMAWTDADAGTVVVMANRSVWVVDLRVTPPAAARRPIGVSTQKYGASLGAGRFAVGDDHYISLVDAAVPSAPVVTVFHEGSQLATFQAADAAPGVLAVASCTGHIPNSRQCRSPVELVLFDTGDPASPPAQSARFPLPATLPVTAVAFSRDLGTIAVAQQGAAGQVTTFATADGLVPIATVPVEEPLDIVASGSEFHVGALGEVVRLSASSGQRIASLRFPARVSSAAVRTARCTVTGVDRDGEVLEAALSTVGAVARLAPRTLQRYLTADGCDQLFLPAGVEVARLATLPGRSSLFAQSGETVWKLGPGEDESGATERWTPPGRIGALASRALRPLLPTAGGALLVAHRNSTDGDQVAVLNAAATWDAGYAPLSVASGRTLLAFAADEGGRLLVAGRGRVDGVNVNRAQLFDLAQAVAGTAAPLGAPIEFAERPAFAAAARDRFFVITEIENALRVIQPDGAVSSPVPVPAVEVTTAFAAAPGARRLWFLVERSGARRLVSYVFDPDQARILAEDPSIDLTPGASELYPYADGALLLVVDPEADRLFLLE